MHPPNATLHRHEQFHSVFLPDDRDLLVWLPPGYADQPDRRYPVLYMHDGQNLFDPDTAFQPGEHWRVGETAAGLIASAELHPLIIVGIYNTGDERIHEYTPTKDARLGGGLAGAYGRLIVEEVKPLIDRTYRTLPDADHTGLGGSSLGGLATLHLGFTHHEVFSRLAELSPSVGWDRRAVLKTVRQARPRPALRLWVDMGTAEGRRGLDDARLLKAALVGAGYAEGVDLHYAEFEGATHSEAAWAARVGPMLKWLFPP
ncbi:MAG: alpha/beta hydrolase-fold protein, partial [Acidobacteriota bacterium]|nr:alpha/beta hydrolase-fold protein [Acidobacteriota bacterium]